MGPPSFRSQALFSIEPRRGGLYIRKSPADAPRANRETPMLLKMAKRLLLETDKRLLWKLVWNFGFKGMLSVERHKRRLKRGALELLRRLQGSSSP